MPFRLPFNFPYSYNSYRYSPNYARRYHQPQVEKSNTNKSVGGSEQNPNQKISESSNNDSETSEYFFEIFGLKLYFDDILIICILFFLYTENVQDEELFICLVLLLIT